MRLKERIPIVLEYLKDDNNKVKVIEYILKDVQLDNLDMKPILVNWRKCWSRFEKLYKYYIDLRVTQALVNTDIIPNYQGMWYYIEDESLLIEAEVCEARDVIFWDRSFDADNNKLKKTEYILVKDLDTSHIYEILKLDYISKRMREILENELKYRGENI